MSGTFYAVSIVALVVYIFSIVFGRIYTGMHSFTDCAFGLFLGTAIWAVFTLCGDALDHWLKTSGWIGTPTLLNMYYLTVKLKKNLSAGNRYPFMSSHGPPSPRTS